MNLPLLFVRNCFIMNKNYGGMGAHALGELIAMASGKGGTGKTSLCAGIAQALSMLGNRVLCVDCDVGLRNLDIALGMEDCGALSFLDVCAGGYDLSQSSQHPDYPSLRFLTAPVNDSADQVDISAFGEMLSRAREQFDYVLLDAPAGLESGFFLAARYADRVLLVAGSDPASIRDAGRTAQVLEQMKKTNVRLIVNRVRAKLVKAMGLTVDDIMDQAGLPLMGIVPEDPKVPLAAAAGMPLLRYPRGGASAACRRIAKRITGMPVPVAI